MLKIGEFSRLSRISIRMLRHYDEIGLMKPGMVDKFTGYRYYRESQLLLAERINVLKNMGFGLSMIGRIVEEYDNAGELEKFLLEKKRDLEEQDRQARQKIQLIDNTIQWLRKDENMMGYDVVIKTLPERYVASLRMVIPAYDQEGILWKRMMEETAKLHVQDQNPCWPIAIFHDGEYKEKDVDVEIQKCVAGTYRDTEHVKFKTVPPAQIASATYKGDYLQINRVNRVVAQWIDDNGYEFDGLFFNIYHVGPNQTQNPEEYVTEICYPVKKK